MEFQVAFTPHGVCCRMMRCIFVLFIVLQISSSAQSVARIWNEENLAAIRVDFPNPPVHARNLFYVSVAMYDAWAAYQTNAVGYLYHPYENATNVPAARDEAISFAAFRVLEHRYALSVNATNTLPALTNQLVNLGYNPSMISTNGSSPAAVGNRVAAEVIAFSLVDGSNQTLDPPYTNPIYSPVNEPLILAFNGTTLVDPNRWQPLAFDVRVTQNGLIAELVQEFIGSHWGATIPFGMSLLEGETVYFDPGIPPQLGGAEDAGYKSGNLEVLRYSSLLDPDNGIILDISPGHIGNNTLGSNDGTGHPINPATGQPYMANPVLLGDYGRVSAEFWADGPDSETPPGHWNSIANHHVVDHPNFERRFEGTGPVLDPLEWDVKMYFALNAAAHNAAISAWGCKNKYDYIRPISSIRHLCQTQQMPLTNGLVEVVTNTSNLPGQRHEGLPEGVIAIYSWGGEPANPETEYTGAKWIRGDTWLPYQRDTFVTPAFAGYVSGHSTFSRAAAEILTAMTGSMYFPGGMATFTASQNDFLEFEQGPSQTVQLQWATFYDAADEAGLSRLYGGIHVPVDDGPGRIMGSQAGIAAWQEATKYFDGSILDELVSAGLTRTSNGTFRIQCNAIRGMHYTLEQGETLDSTVPVASESPAKDSEVVFEIDPSVTPGNPPVGFFKIQRRLLP